MSRIQAAFLCYLVLGAIAIYSLRGDYRLAVLILLGGLAIKTYIAHLRKRGTGIGPDLSTMPADKPAPSSEEQEK
jgi:hypothetical protein